MNYIKLSKFFKLEIKPFLLGVFLSRIMEAEINNDKFFYTYSSFKSSNVVYKDDFDLITYANVLKEKFNKKSGHYNWVVDEQSTSTSIKISFYILNDLNLPKKMFYQALYQKTLTSSWISDENFNDSKKDFIRGFIESRGSVDTNRNFIAQDYFYDNKNELKKALILTNFMNIPVKYINFNARDLQPQFVSGINKRNTQLRINSLFYAKYIGFINYYKAQIFKNTHTTLSSYELNEIKYFQLQMPTSSSDEATFLKYINFFTDNIYKKELSKESIKTLRKKLGFKISSDSSNQQRNKAIIDLFDEITPDVCAVCGTTKTYAKKNTGRQYFEIHHVISFYNDKELDNPANLVKLCPTCHHMLKKNSGKKEDQILAIKKILSEHDEIFDFTSSYLGIEDLDELCEKIWEKLG